MSEAVSEYLIGVMKTPVEQSLPAFNTAVDRAVEVVETQFAKKHGSLRTHLFEFIGPHLSPVAGAYAPLDFLEIGLAEKIERRLHFLIIVTEVDLTASTQSYALALPSQITNIGIISTKRLAPEFWGEPSDPNRMAQRLVALMLHTIGHLLNLRHSRDPANVMYDFGEVGDLDHMRVLSPEQIGLMQQHLPDEARDDIGSDNRTWFAIQQTLANTRSIVRTVLRANPLSLALHLPAMITAALSVDILLFFTAEIWDVASTVDLYQLVVFSLISLTAGTAVLHRAFALNVGTTRRRAISESVVVARAATIITLLLTLIVLYIVFFAATYVSIITIFPEKLMATWPTVDPAVRLLDHVKLSTFLAAMGILAGSLGGTAGRKDLVRQVLFLDEES